MPIVKVFLRKIVFKIHLKWLLKIARASPKFKDKIWRVPFEFPVHINFSLGEISTAVNLEAWALLDNIVIGLNLSKITTFWFL